MVEFNKNFINEIREKKRQRKEGGGGMPEVDILLACDDEDKPVCEQHWCGIDWNADEKSFSIALDIRPCVLFTIVIWGFRISIS